jgi:hypothetical protein
MGSVTDFLFEGKPPKSVNTYGQTIENVPKWMSDYTQGLIARANAAAAEPYIPYGGPRIAPFAPEEEAAFGMAEENVGAYQPWLEAGAEGVRGGLDRFGEQYDPRGAADPYLTSGTEEFPEGVDRYMDPYVQNVLDRQESLASRTFEEKFLPGLQKSFTGAGQFGSRGGEGSMEQIGMRGVRDIQEGLEEQRLATLSGAYGQAGELFGADRARDIQAGEIRGGLEEAGGRLGVQQGLGMLQAGETAGGLGERASKLGYGDAAAMEAVGKTRRGMGQASLDLGYQDFREQRDLPMDRTRFMSEMIRGLPSSAIGRTTQRQDYGPADIYQPSGLSQIVGAYGAYRGMRDEFGNAEGGYIDNESGEYFEPNRYAHGGLALAGKH